MDRSDQADKLGIVLALAIGAGSLLGDHHQAGTEAPHTQDEAPRDQTIRSPAALHGSNLVASGLTLELLRRASDRYFAQPVDVVLQTLRIG